MGRVNVKVNIDLKGLQELQKNMAERYYTKVGILAGKASQLHAGGNQTMVEIGLQHEFGVMKSRSFVYKGEKVTVKGVPARSFLRMPLDLKGKEVVKNFVADKEKIKKIIITEGMKPLSDKLGILAEGVIQEAFETAGFGQWERNINKHYIALKGSDQPLIDTGALRRSITYKVIKQNG